MRGSIQFLSEYYNVKADSDYKPIGCEIGVRDGDNAVEIIEGVGVDRLYLIDSYLPYQDDLFYLDQTEQNYHYIIMFKNLFPFLNKITLIHQASYFASLLFKDGFFDFVYIDANHSKDAIKQDLLLWIAKVKNGGFICGHDFYNDVAQEVKEFAASAGKSIMVFPDSTDWLLKKG